MEADIAFWAFIAGMNLVLLAVNVAHGSWGWVALNLVIIIYSAVAVIPQL